MNKAECLTAGCREAFLELPMVMLIKVFLHVMTNYTSAVPPFTFSAVSHRKQRYLLARPTHPLKIQTSSLPPPQAPVSLFMPRHFIFGTCISQISDFPLREPILLGSADSRAFFPAAKVESRLKGGGPANALLVWYLPTLEH